MRSYFKLAGRSSSLVMLIIILVLPVATWAEGIRLPVYDLSDVHRQTIFDIGVNQITYPEGTEYEVKSQNGMSGISMKTPEDTIKGYIDSLVKKRYDRLSRFYSPEYLSEIAVGMNPRSVGKLIMSDMDDIDKISFDKKWLFGRRYQFVILYLIDRKGKKTLLPIGIEKKADRYYRTDYWGKRNDVHLLFQYMAGEYTRADTGKRGSRKYEHSVKINCIDGRGREVRDNPVTIYFDGIFYKPENAGSTVGKTDKELCFVHKVIDISSHGTDEEFVNLYFGKERKEMKNILVAAPEEFKDYKRSFYVPEGEAVKHIFTASLGRHFIHYYYAEGAPHNVRQMFFMKEGSGLWLSDSLFANIRALFTDDHFVRRIVNMWNREKESTH